MTHTKGTSTTLPPVSQATKGAIIEARDTLKACKLMLEPSLVESELHKQVNIALKRLDDEVINAVETPPLCGDYDDPIKWSKDINKSVFQRLKILNEGLRDE